MTMKTKHNTIDRETMRSFESFLGESPNAKSLMERYLAYREANGWESRRAMVGTKGTDALFKGPDGKPMQIGNAVNELSREFLDGWKAKALESVPDSAPKGALDLYRESLEKKAEEMVRFLSRKIRDWLEDAANAIRRKLGLDKPDNPAVEPEEPEQAPVLGATEVPLPGFAEDAEHAPAKKAPKDPEETFEKAVKEDPKDKADGERRTDGMCVVETEWNKLINVIGRVANALDSINDTLRGALFVRDGDLRNRETGKARRVDWPWLRSINSEIAQMRGIVSGAIGRKQDTEQLDYDVAAAGAASGNPVPVNEETSSDKIEKIEKTEKTEETEKENSING